MTLRIFEKLGGGQREAAGVSTGRPALLSDGAVRRRGQEKAINTL